MLRYRFLSIALILATGMVLLVTGSGPSLSAQRPSRAALVIQTAPIGDQADPSAARITRCISFSETSISGLELLARSGLKVVTWGGAVCRIEQTGCQYPSEPCFCQCLRPPCSYWSYWYWKDNRWMYSAIGSADHGVVDGSVEAWMWGNAETPPDTISFAEVCPPDSTPEPAPSTPTDTVDAPPIGQYLLFAGMALALLGGFWLTRRRTTSGPR